MEQLILSVKQHLSEHYEIYIRITLSAVLGFLIGWDREAKHKPAGLKTYMYVCVASALITLISIYSVEKFSQITERIMMDPMRLTAQIVSGLGFLGAGVILKNGLQVKGLTSAAMILFAGGVGIGIGAGFYAFVIFAVLLSSLLARLGNLMEKRKYRRSSQEDIFEEVDDDTSHSSSI
ncbi:MgtC/SapB family protein [Paenibacillus sp. J5C_2022]|uniref:MgtC/SapB family protein n=1 Tax=Paenibacillus sp. J5C2022 TaxID=2977129 RepID=UPI0021CEBCD4|nr:MgtC/SapB family protein [Paenibacillus sp. J5C2022]MCU6710601.1 MgtC/SapB family protein [Paenibacillus sp. J5C2022]